MPAKSELRLEVQARIQRLSSEARATGSEGAVRLLRAQAAWQRAQRILLFAPMPGELDIWPLAGEALSQGKTVALPRFLEATGGYVACAIANCDHDVCAGKFGIREPRETCSQIALNRLDFLLVPGLAFDLHGHRLGRGKGFFDRLLAAARGFTCGVCFDEQLVEEIPVEPHDKDVDCILTPTRWIEP